MSKYDDIINFEYKKSQRHPSMSMIERASQFSPFAALVGYEDIIDENKRLVDRKIELSKEEKDDLDYTLAYIESILSLRPLVKITYFISDKSKKGGEYISISTHIKKIDTFNRLLILEDKSKIAIDDIISLSL